MSIRNVNFVLFGDYKELEARPELTLKITSKLIENGVAMNPGTFQQFNPTQNMKIYERIMFNNPKDKIQVRINVDAIEINTTIVDNKEYNFKSHQDHFILKVKKIIKALKDSIPDLSQGVRVSLITEITYDKDKIKSFEDIYSVFNNKIPNYSLEETFEWNTRAVKRMGFELNGSQETLNLVTEVFRVSGEISDFGEISVFDTVSTKIDINTVPFNNSPRINETFISEFLDTANNLFLSHNEPIEVEILGKQSN